MSDANLDSLAISLAAGLRMCHLLYWREMGTLIPDMLPRDQFHRVLEVVCGAGTWSIDFARMYPHKHIIGIDTRSHLLQLAREDALTARLPNIHFELFQVGQPFTYANNRFDFIRTGRSNDLIFPRIWPSVLKELMRILKPGGWLNLLDFEFGPTSCPAVNRYIQLLREAYTKYYSTDNTARVALTSATLYPQLISQAGCVQVEYQLYPINLGNQKGDIGRDYIKYVIIGDSRIAWFIAQQGVASQEELLALQRIMRVEVEKLDYCGAGMLVSVVGQKPTVPVIEGDSGGRV